MSTLMVRIVLQPDNGVVDLRKILGIFLCGIAFLAMSITISSAKVSMYLDALQGDHYTTLYQYINPLEMTCSALILVIAVYLIVKKNPE